MDISNVTKLITQQLADFKTFLDEQGSYTATLIAITICFVSYLGYSNTRLKLQNKENTSRRKYKFKIEQAKQRSKDRKRRKK